MKKLISLLLTCSMTVAPYVANSQNLYTQTITQKINNAIRYEQKNIITDSGWIRAYVAYIDITNPNASIKVLTAPNGSSHLATVKKMASHNDAALAINGDFFNFSSGQTNMIGMAYSDGEMISSPAPDNMVSFVLTDDNEVIMDYFSFSSVVTSPQGYQCPIYQINKIPVDTGSITMLTSKWSAATPGKGYRAMIVEDGIVTGFKEASSEPVPMPQNGYVLVTNPEVNGYFDNFVIGSPVSVVTELTPDVRNIKEATGGNTLIVDKGRVCNFTSNITGYAQRSSVGISADGKTLILVATDGRESDCKGLTQTGLAELMIQLGAYKAINLDGGGSTTFVKKEADGSYVVENNVSSERSVSTAIGVFDNKLRGQEIVRGEIIASSKVVLSGDSVNLDVVFYDEYDNAVLYNSADTLITDDSGNPISREGYIPKSGLHSVYASVNGIGCSVDIEAVETLDALEASADTAEIEAGMSVQFDVYGYDSFGRRFKISPHLLSWQSSNPAVTVERGSVYAMAKEASVIEVRHLNTADYININKAVSRTKAPAPISEKDYLYGTVEDGNETAISGIIPSGATLLNRYFSNIRLKSIGSYTKSYIAASFVPDGASGIESADKYSAYVSDKTVFATLNNSEKYIKTSADWSSIATALGTPYPNVVIISELSLESMLPGDRILLKEMLENSVSGQRNVFFVSSGETNSAKIENGVRYITCGSVADYRTNAMEQVAKSASYVVFSTSGDEIRYEFRQD